MRARKDQHKINNVHGKRNFSFVVIMITIGVSLAIGVYGYFFKRYVLSPYGRFRALHSEIHFPQEYTVRGIDVSRYQGQIKWDALKTDQIGGEDIQFVFIKATEGVSISDPYFKRNFNQARDKGILRGAYHYFTPSVSGVCQAQYFIKHVALTVGDLPPVLDVEEIGNLSRTTLQKEVLDWLTYVENYYGVKPIIYSGHNFKKKYLNTPQLNKFPLWIAHYYKDELEYDGNWLFWQNTDLGNIKGIKGDVDLNIFNGSLNDLHALTIDTLKH